MLEYPAIMSALRIAPVPFAGCVYKSTQTTTTNEDTTTFSAVDIGVPHPKRIVVLAMYAGAAVTPSSVVNGYDQYFQQVGSNGVAIAAVRVPTGSTATIAVTATGSVRKAVSVYVAYPTNPWILESSAAIFTTTDAAVFSDLDTKNGGFVVYAGVAFAAGNSTPSWSGSDAITEDADAVIESAAQYNMGHVNITVSNSLDDLTVTNATSTSRSFAVASFGA